MRTKDTVRTMLRWSLFTLLAMLPAVGAAAQTSSGSLSGTVRDGSGAVVAHAVVAARQNASGRVIRQESNADGGFALFSLDPGAYRITVTKTGFETSIVDNVQVGVAQTLSLDVSLTVGNVTSEVLVTADQQMLSNDSPTLSSTVTRQVLEDTPLPDRSALQLAVFTAGVTGDPQFSNGSQSEVPGIFLNPATPGASFSIGGGRPGLASQLIDGFDTTLNAYPRAGLTLSGETTEAIAVQQNGLEAQYGRTGGGILNQATRGGGSQYHGALSFRHQEPKFEANLFNTPFRAAKHQNEFGGVVSGPVPTLGELMGRGRAKQHSTFFLVAIEPLRQSDQNYSRGRLPTPDEISGRLNNSLDLLNTTILRSSGYAAALAAPRVGNLFYQYNLNAQGFPTGSQLPTSQYVQIPSNDLSAQVSKNATAKSVTAYYPTPTSPGKYAFFLHPDASYDSDGNNAYVVRGVQSRDDRYSVRVDQTIGDHDKLFGRYSSVPVTGNRYNFLGPSTPANSIASDNYYSKSIAFGETHIFGSTMVNEFRASYLRSNRQKGPTPAALSKDFGPALGLLPAVNGQGFPTLSGLIQGVGSGGSQADGGRSLDVNQGFGDDFSILRGNHSIKIGTEILALQLNRLDNSYLSGGQYNFSSAGTNSGSSGGMGMASFYLGLIQSFTTAAPQPYYYRWKYYAGYVQDTWKVSPKLTLSMGMRYSLEVPRKEKFNLQGSFDPTTAGNLNGVAATGALVLAGQNGRIDTIYPINYKGFEPRVGLSYAVNGATTVHASYALVHAPLTGVGDVVVPNLAAAAQTVGPTTGGTSVGALNYITNPIAPIPALPTQKTSPIFGFSAAAILPQISQSNAVPYVQMWSLVIDRQIGSKISLQATYVGNKGTHLYSDQYPTNIPALPSLLSGIQQHLQFGSTNLASNGVANKYGLGNETYLQSLNPYQQFYNNPITTYYERSTSSIYHGAYVSAARRFSEGVSMFANFSWSKSLDSASDNTVDLTNIYGEAQQQTSYNKPQRSYSSFDTPLRLAGGYTVELPVGKGKLLNVNNRLLNLVVGGWVTTGLFSMQDGFPFFAKVGGNAYFVSTLPVCSGAVTANCTATLQYGSGGAAISTASINGSITPGIVPNLNKGVPLINPNWRKDPTGVTSAGGYVNNAAFSVPGSIDNPQFGNAPRTLGQLRNPYSVYWDETVRKNIPLYSERVKLQLQMDVINIMNHPNFFFNPGAGAHNLTTGNLSAATGVYTNSAGFGVLGNISPARQIALGAKLSF